LCPPGEKEKGASEYNINIKYYTRMTALFIEKEGCIILLNSMSPKISLSFPGLSGYSSVSMFNATSGKRMMNDEKEVTVASPLFLKP
jgi:hypothetical protein